MKTDLTQRFQPTTFNEQSFMNDSWYIKEIDSKLFNIKQMEKSSNPTSTTDAIEL